MPKAKGSESGGKEYLRWWMCQRRLVSYCETIICILVRVLVCFVDEELAIGVDEEERIFVAVFEDPAAAILAIYFKLVVFATYSLLSKEVVVAVEHLHQVVAAVAYHEIYQVAAHCEVNHIGVVVVAHVFANHYHIGGTVVVPVAVAVAPETVPAARMEGYGIPEAYVHVHHMMMVRMVEVGSRMDRTLSVRHMATRMARGSISAARHLTCGADVATVAYGLTATVASVAATSRTCSGTVGRHTAAIGSGVAVGGGTSARVNSTACRWGHSRTIGGADRRRTGGATVARRCGYGRRTRRRTNVGGTRSRSRRTAGRRVAATAAAGRRIAAATAAGRRVAAATAAGRGVAAMAGRAARTRGGNRSVAAATALCEGRNAKAEGCAHKYYCH